MGSVVSASALLFAADLRLNDRDGGQRRHLHACRQNYSIDLGQMLHRRDDARKPGGVVSGDCQIIRNLKSAPFDDIDAFGTNIVDNKLG